MSGQARPTIPSIDGVERAAHLGGGPLAVLGTGGVERGLVEGAAEHVGEGRHRLHGQQSGVHQPLERDLDQPEAVAGGDLAPPLPAQRGGSLHQHDPVDLRLGAHRQPAVDPRVQGGHRVVVVRAGQQDGDPLDDLGLHLLEHGREQVLLAAELVVERAAGDAGRAGHLVGADGGVALRGEQRPGRRHERSAGGRRPVGLSSFAFHTTCP